MKKLNYIIAFTLLLLGGSGAELRAQTPPNPPATSWYPPPSVQPPTLAVTNASARVALPAAPTVYPVVTVVNVGAQEIFCRLGDAAVTVTTASYEFAIPANNGYRAVWDASSAYVACITASSTSTARITQSNGGPTLGFNGAPASLPPSGAAGGDLAGTYPNPTVTNLGTAVTANAVNSTSPGTIGNYFGTMRRPEDFGAICNGNTANATVDTTAIKAALTRLYSDGGGTLLISGPSTGHGNCIVNATLLLPNSNPGSGYPTQPNIRITGESTGFFDGSWVGTPTGGSTITFIAGTYAVAKIDTRGIGALEIDHLTLVSTDTGGAVPFIQTTNTTIKAHDDAFYGANANASANEDVFVLGGCTICTGTIDGAATSEFQGYGTVINANYFAKIKHMAAFNTYGNAIIFRDNTCSTSCGSATVGDAAILITGGTVGGSQSYDTGNLIEGNLIEAIHYSYAIKALACAQCEFIANNAYDNPSLLATIYLDSVSISNLVLGGTEGGGASVYLTDVSGGSSYISTSGNNQISTLHGLKSGDSGVPNLFGATTFTGGAGNTNIQPALASNNQKIFQLSRSAAEGTNPNGNLFQFNNDGAQAWGNNPGAGNITCGLATCTSWSNNGRTWGFPGASGGAMAINSGNGGSILTLQNFEVLFKDHTGATQGRFYSTACAGDGIGFDFGASFDASICRKAAGSLETVGSLTTPAIIAGGSAPTITGSGTFGAQTGGNTAGTFVATMTAQTAILTFATTAPTGWNCNAHDRTTPTDSLNQTASSPTSCTLTGTTVASDVVSFDARAY